MTTVAEAPPHGPRPREANGVAVRAPRTRADALRNRERIVAAASDIFVEYGPDAPLDEIARRAGIGNATLYRHFPTVGPWPTLSCCRRGPQRGPRRGGGPRGRRRRRPCARSAASRTPPSTTSRRPVRTVRQW